MDVSFYDHKGVEHIRIVKDKFNTIDRPATDADRKAYKEAPLELEKPAPRKRKENND